MTAEAMQPRTTVVIDPPDADGDEANGYQVALAGVAEITVTSADGSRTRVYRVALGGNDNRFWPHLDPRNWHHPRGRDQVVGAPPFGAEVTRRR